MKFFFFTDILLFYFSLFYIVFILYKVVKFVQSKQIYKIFIQDFLFFVYENNHPPKTNIFLRHIFDNDLKLSIIKYQIFLLLFQEKNHFHTISFLKFIILSVTITCSIPFTLFVQIIIKFPLQRFFSKVFKSNLVFELKNISLSYLNLSKFTEKAVSLITSSVFKSFPFQTRRNENNSSDPL